MSHSPEPWTDAYSTVYTDTDKPSHNNDVMVADCRTNDVPASVARENAKRIAACVNFCRQFDTEFLASRQLVKVSQGEGGELKGTLADIPGFDGLMAVALIPVQKSTAR